MKAKRKKTDEEIYFEEESEDEDSELTDYDSEEL